MLDITIYPSRDELIGLRKNKGEALSESCVRLKTDRGRDEDNADESPRVPTPRVESWVEEIWVQTHV